MLEKPDILKIRSVILLLLYSQNSTFCWLMNSRNQRTYTVWCLGVESDLLLTNDAVEHLSQCLEVFQNEDVLLTTFLWGQRVQLIFLHLVPNTKYIHIWKHTHKCTDTVYIVVNRNIYDHYGDVWIWCTQWNKSYMSVENVNMYSTCSIRTFNLFLILWYPALSRLCDPGMCRGSPADSGSGPGQSEAWCLCWSNLQAETHEEGMRAFKEKAHLIFPFQIFSWAGDAQQMRFQHEVRCPYHLFLWWWCSESH